MLDTLVAVALSSLVWVPVSTWTNLFRFGGAVFQRFEKRNNILIKLTLQKECRWKTLQQQQQQKKTNQKSSNAKNRFKRKWKREFSSLNDENQR